VSASCDVVTAYREPIGMFIFKKCSCRGVWAPVGGSYIEKKNYIHTLRFYERKSNEYHAGVSPPAVTAAEVAAAHEVLHAAIATLATEPAIASLVLEPPTPGMNVPFPSSACPADIATSPVLPPSTPTIAILTAAMEAACAPAATGGEYMYRYIYTHSDSVSYETLLVRRSSRGGGLCLYVRTYRNDIYIYIIYIYTYTLRFSLL
jgi:hypothetical protein